ncbi:MAG TPA: tryptophan--tRNA ligase [Saprospiraceae bacterium]|nr:tryptophan--tRNA ligase [Saprospiraceae bacterium]
MQKTVLSGIQPTGDLHLGNYFGAVANWVKLQKEYTCYFGIVDCHSMTMPYDAALLKDNTWKMAYQVLACDVDPERLFIQSLVPEHLELSWIMGCIASYGELSRMTQFKDKVDQLKTKDKDAFVSAGLFFYPVLQAADILIYKADYVPVGKDQEQHLELTRNIAERFNHQFNVDYFKLPESLFTEVPKLLSTADPNKKMSKSLGEKHFINLLGEETVIRKQIKSAVTDTGDSVGEMAPGVQNLFTILKACGNMDAFNSFTVNYNDGNLRYGDLKEVVADTLISFLLPIKEQYLNILANKKQYQDQIYSSSQEIRKIARKTLDEVREITGLLKLNY